MSMSDPIADLLTRIRNAQRVGKKNVVSPASRMRQGVLDVLVREGYIRSYSVTEIRSGVSEINIELRYRDGRPVIEQINKVSKPGRRVYTKLKDLKPFYNGLGIYIISTSKGILSDGEARKQHVSGEVICNVF